MFGHQRGQSVIELAISVPALLLLLLGSFDSAVMASDKVIAGNAVRQGARLAAELGGSQTNPSATTAQLDQNIVKNVLAVATSMNYSSLQEIDIYSPRAANGVFNPATDPYDRFDGAGTLQYQGFPINQRNQIPPTETSIGVRVVWRYTPPNVYQGFSIVLNEYAVMKAAPVLLT